jgi:hypothetical protein
MLKKVSLLPDQFASTVLIIFLAKPRTEKRGSIPNIEYWNLFAIWNLGLDFLLHKPKMITKGQEDV